MSKCICEGNLRLLVKETEGQIGKYFTNKGIEYKFFGLVIGDDDYYYGMWDIKNQKLMLLSCVGNLDTHEFDMKE